MSYTENAKEPKVSEIKAQLKSKNLISADVMSRICAAAKGNEAPSLPTCTGNLTIGMFFDGTGNNEQADYYGVKDSPEKMLQRQQSNGSRKKPLESRQCKHSNVVRLFHTFQTEFSSSQGQSTHKCYKFYIPGVGTPFPEINDKGNALGSATAWGGEPRILWGLIQVINAVHQYYKDDVLMEDVKAGNMANDLAYGSNDRSRVIDNIEKEQKSRASPVAAAAIGLGNRVIDFLGGTIDHHQKRRNAFQKILVQLKAAIPPNAKPSIRKINLSVFAFSRGSAQARAFVNWLNELCEGPPSSRTLAGIPLQIQFMGIFDTVASVGMASMFSIVEGRQDWANENMQIPNNTGYLRKCVHMVSAHEVRACFPMDSARINHKYPKNTTEIVYPGTHSDVGGGYLPKSLGKDDWFASENNPDHQIARIPGFDMYCKAMAAGVPFYTFEQLEKLGLHAEKNALLPAEKTLDDVEKYLKEANISEAPVEEMAKKHLSYYHAWRWKMGRSAVEWKKNPEYRRMREHWNSGVEIGAECAWYEKTQNALLTVVSVFLDEIEHRIKFSRGGKEPLQHPLLVAGALVTTDPSKAPEILEKWRRWLNSNQQPEWHDQDAVEREGIWLLDALLQAEKVSGSMAEFFGRHIHDSMAGFIGAAVNEFTINSYGLGKFRRIYFGNDGDSVLRTRVADENQKRLNDIKTMKEWVDRLKPFEPKVPPNFNLGGL